MLLIISINHSTIIRIVKMIVIVEIKIFIMFVILKKDNCISGFEFPVHSFSFFGFRF